MHLHYFVDENILLILNSLENKDIYVSVAPILIWFKFNAILGWNEQYVLLKKTVLYLLNSSFTIFKFNAKSIYI